MSEVKSLRSPTGSSKWNFLKAQVFGKTGLEGHLGQHLLQAHPFAGRDTDWEHYVGPGRGSTSCSRAVQSHPGPGSSSQHPSGQRSCWSITLTLLGWRHCCNSSNANFQSPCASIPLPGACPVGPMHTTTHGVFHYKPQSDKECLADIKDISHLPIWWKVLLLAENREDCYSKIYHMAPLCRALQVLSLSVQVRFQPLKKCCIVSLDMQEPLERSCGRWLSFVLLVCRQLVQPQIFPLAGAEQPHGTEILLMCPAGGQIAPEIP